MGISSTRILRRPWKRAALIIGVWFEIEIFAFGDVFLMRLNTSYDLTCQVRLPHFSCCNLVLTEVHECRYLLISASFSELSVAFIFEKICCFGI